MRVLTFALLAVALAAPHAGAQTPAGRLSAATLRERLLASPAATFRVQITAVVTLHDTARGLTFVQDDSGGVFVVPAAGAAAIEPGQVVQVSGVAAMSPRGPAITAAAFVVRGRAALPRPAPPAAAGALDALDGSLVALRGVVQRVDARGTGREAHLGTASGQVTVPLPGGQAGIAADAVVLVQGVLSLVRDAAGAVEWREVLPTAGIRVEQPAEADPFAAPLVRTTDLPRAMPVTGVSRRVKVSGVVTRFRPGRSLYLRTDTGPLYVETSGEEEVAPGARVEAVGFPAVDDFAPFLEEAAYRQVGMGPPPEPVVATIAELVGGKFDAELVRVSATFLSSEEGRFEHTLVMQEGPTVFNAHVLIPSAQGLPGRLQPGERVQLTGICSVVVDTDRRPRSFRVLLRDGADVTVLASAPPPPGGGGTPWWAYLSLLAAAGALVAMGLVFRKRQDQEETIRRQQAREAALKARFDDLFDRSSEVLVVHDRRGRVSTLNRAGEQATGYSREELRVLDPNWIFTPEYLDAIHEMLAGGADAAPRSFHTELMSRKGPRIPVDVHARVLVGDGQVVGITAIARDLSERERLENELRQAQKMEAVGRLATGIAHDFNNLITVLLGYSDELIEHVADDSEWKRPAQEIRRAAERASGLTQQLLSFSRRQASVPQTVDLGVTVAKMEDLVRRLLGPEIRLEFRLAPGLAPIRADASQMGQIVMNLVVNARDAMPEGGAITVETANVTLGADNLDVIPGPHVMLAVHDTGIGMSPEVRKRLFEPFFTTKETGQGTGLGLSMVHAIVRQSGGHLAVESEPGKGSTFRLYFPRLNEAAPPIAASIAPPVAAVKGAGVVLLAEDDRSVRRLVTTELGRRGFTVIDAEDGRAALDLLKEHQDRVDILVTDVVMPRMNGVDLAAAAETLRPGLKVLFISGHPERAGAGLDPTGRTNLLMKPFTADVLAARIKEMIAGATGA